MTDSLDRLQKKVQGCLYGGAIGDAMGGPAEWHTPEEIRARYGYITDLVEGWDGPSDIGKGDGRYTDSCDLGDLAEPTRPRGSLVYVAADALEAWTRLVYYLGGDIKVSH